MYLLKTFQDLNILLVCNVVSLSQMVHNILYPPSPNFALFNLCAGLKACGYKSENFLESPRLHHIPGAACSVQHSREINQ